MAATGWAAEGDTIQTKPASTGEISLEELMKIEIPVVEAASKYKQKITEAPSSVTIVTSDEVKKYGYRTLSDILESVPGLYTSYDRNYSFLGVRGFNRGDYNSRVLLLVDGHRINNSLSDGAAIGTDFILDVDLIDRVEVIRGPGSSLYGNNAFFGVINVITRKGRDMAGVGGEVSGEVAALDTYKGRVSYGNRFKNGLELLLSGTIYDSLGHDSLYYPAFDQNAAGHVSRATNNGISLNADGDHYKSFFGSVGFHELSLEGGWIRREKVNPTAPLSTLFNDTRAQTLDERSYMTLKFAHEFAKVGEVTAQVYYDRQDYQSGYPFPPAPGVLYKDIGAAEWWGTELQFTRHFWDRLTLTAGGEYRDDFRQAQKTIDADTGVSFGEVHTNRQNYGAYLEGDLAVLTNLHVNAGFRYDQYGDFDPAFNPRAALISNPFGQSVFKVLYGTAFRAPNLYELDLRSLSPPQVQPETIKTYELVYEQGIGKHLRSSVAGFYNEISDLIIRDVTTLSYTNSSGARAHGVEAALDGFWPSGLRGRVSYTFQETEDRSTDQVLTDSPKHLGRINLSVPVLKDKLFAGLEFQYTSKRTTLAGTEAGGFGVLNFTLFSQNLVKGLDISASVYNLADSRYYDPTTPVHFDPNAPAKYAPDNIEQDRRSFRVKLTYRF